MRQDELPPKKIPKGSKERLAQKRGLNLNSFPCLGILLHFVPFLQEELKLNGITVKSNFIPVLLIWAQSFKTAYRHLHNQLQTAHTHLVSGMNLVTSANLYGAKIRKLVCE